MRPRTEGKNTETRNQYKLDYQPLPASVLMLIRVGQLEVAFLNRWLSISLCDGRDKTQLVQNLSTVVQFLNKTVERKFFSINNGQCKEDMYS